MKYDWFAVMFGYLWLVPHVEQEMLTLSGTTDFTPFVDFMILPIHISEKQYTYRLSHESENVITDNSVHKCAGPDWTTDANVMLNGCHINILFS